MGTNNNIPILLIIILAIAYFINNKTQTVLQNNCLLKHQNIAKNVVPSEQFTKIKKEVFIGEEQNMNQLFDEIEKETNFNSQEPNKKCVSKGNNIDKFVYSGSEGFLIDELDDTVDKVEAFRETRRKNIIGEKISDIYDDMTSAPDFEKKCLKKPYIDDISHEGMYFTMNDTPLKKTIKPDQWMYDKELVMNGGTMGNGLYGYDPKDGVEIVPFDD